MGQIDFDGSNSTVKADVIRGQTGTTVKLGGVLDTDGNYIQTEKGGDLTSASPLVIDTDGDYFDVTGTTNFAAMTVAADRQFTLQFDGVLTMTHHATNLDLPSEANITTAAGDVATFQSTGADTVQCINYTKADGTGIVAAGGGGKVLQVVTSERTAATSFSTSSWVAAGVSAAITPSNSSNKVIMLCNCNGLYRSNHDTFHRLQVLVTDDVRTDEVVVTGISNMAGMIDSSQTPFYAEDGILLQRLDSPNTTAECTYTLYCKNHAGVGSCYIAESGGMGATTVVSMLLLEIDGT